MLSSVPAAEPDVRPDSHRSSSSGISVFRSGMTVDGRIRGKEEILINGKVKGRLDVRGRVIVDQQGLVTADIKADEIVIRGKVQGDIDCHRANIEPGGELLGDVASPRMMLADGAVFKGKIDMAPKDAAPSRSGKSKSSPGAKTS